MYLPRLLEKKFVGTHELRTKLSELLKELHKQGGEVVITRQGKPAAILMDVELYLELQETLQDLSEPGFLEELNQAIEEVEQGKGIPADKVFKKLSL